MVPTSFDGDNAVLGAPAGDDDCGPLNVMKAQMPSGMPVVISCWKATQEEIDEIVRTGRVWLMICGQTMPPASLHGIRPW